MPSDEDPIDDEAPSAAAEKWKFGPKDEGCKPECGLTVGEA